MAETNLQSTLSKDWAYITHHLATVAIIGVLTIGAVYGVESIIARHDASQSAKYEQILAAQTAQTQVLAKQFQDAEAWHAQVETQLLAQNTQLATAMSARNQQLATQVKTDATLSAQESANRIAQQTNAQSGDVTASGDVVHLTLPVARRVTAGLDELPVARQNLADAQTQLANETKIAENAQSDVVAARKVIDSQTTQMADADKVCKAEITTLKAQARKSKLKWFGIGFIAGLITGHAAGL